MRLPISLSLLLSLSLTIQSQIPEIPRFYFSATAVGVDKLPEFYWLDLELDEFQQEKREYRSLRISNGSRGSTIEIPIRAPLNLYRKVQLAEGGERMEPALEIPEQEKGSRIMLVMFRKPDGAGTMRFIDDSSKSHPVGTVRILNTSPGRVVASAGKDPVVVEAGEAVLLGTPETNEKGRFPFDLAASIPNRPTYREPTKLLRLRSPDSRLLVLFTFLPNYRIDESDNLDEIGVPVLVGFKPIAYRLYDKIKPAETEKEGQE